MRKSVEVLINVVFWTIISYLILSFHLSLQNGMTHLTSPNAPGIKFFDDYFLHNYPKYLLNLKIPFVCFYFFYFILVPKFLGKKQILKFSLFAILTIFVSTVIIKIDACPQQYSRFTWQNVSEAFNLALLSALFGCLIKGLILWIKSISEKKAIEKKHLESKTSLLLLKAQINPHFLFNSLNNIDILIEESPRTASEYLKKLSDILRYVLYEIKEDKTELVKEIAQIRNYIELQKIRTDNSRYINFNVLGELKSQKVAPMIFLPFIENAFKHSKNKTIDNGISIEFQLKENNVKMVCKNYYEANQHNVIKNEGLGIETIKQRLNLLYPETHELIIDKTEHWFSVTLRIKLKDGN